MSPTHRFRYKARARTTRTHKFFKVLFIRRYCDAVRGGNIRENNRARALCVINTSEAVVSRNTIARVRTPRYFNFASRRCLQWAGSTSLITIEDAPSAQQTSLLLYRRPRLRRPCPPYEPSHRGDTVTLNRTIRCSRPFSGNKTIIRTGQSLRPRDCGLSSGCSNDEPKRVAQLPMFLRLCAQFYAFGRFCVPARLARHITRVEILVST